jgi:serine/threonine protein kinase
MTEDEEELPAQWLEKLISLDEKIRSGESLPLDDEAPEHVSAGRFLQDLLRLGTPECIGSTGNEMSERQPERIGRYAIGKMIGAGGCAIVYHAWDEAMQRDIALKIPLPSHLMNEENRKRFTLEAQAAARLDHPYIVRAYEAGIEGTLPYIAYEYCSGPTLSQWLRSNGAMKPMDAAKMLSCMADAIHYSHKLKVLHRDLKPSNVLLFPAGTSGHASDNEREFPHRPKLTDFGFAKSLADDAGFSCSSVIVGTPLYAAPEQLNDPTKQPRIVTDIFGLGVLLFEALTNTTPCQGDSLVHVLDKIRSGDYAKLSSRGDIPRDLASICDKALAFNPADRYESAEQMKSDLDRFLRGETVFASRPSYLRILMRTAQSPLRIRDAASFMIFSNAAMLLWISAWPIAIVLDFEIARGATNGELLPYTMPIATLHLVFMILGWQIGKPRAWAAAVGAILSGALTAFQFAVLSSWISPPYPTIYPNIRTRDIVFLLLLTLFLMQFLLSSCSWLAIRCQRCYKRH